MEEELQNPKSLSVLTMPLKVEHTMIAFLMGGQAPGREKR
jgi:hypothetical protein